ncbi:sortase-dependent protein [Streptomyces sp. NPDC004031]
MRARSVLAALGCAAALALAGMGTASADTGAKPTPRPSTGTVARPTAAPAPVPSQAPGDEGQVHAVPRGAADTGVPPVATKPSAQTTATTTAEIAGAALIACAGAGAFVVRRRSAARG